MEKLKQMIIKYPTGSCPCCHRSNFVVVEKNVDAYVTGRDGEILDHRELENSAIGRCINCGKEYHMIHTANGFRPLTSFGLYLYNNSLVKEDKYKFDEIENPMCNGDE